MTTEQQKQPQAQGANEPIPLGMGRPNHLLNVTLFVGLCCLIKFFFNDFVNMLLISIVFAIILRPMINFLAHNLKFPFLLSLFTIFIGFILVLSLIGLIVSNTVNQFISNFQDITQRLLVRITAVHEWATPWLAKIGIEANPDESLTHFITSHINPSMIAEVMKKVWYSLTGFMSGMVIVILTLIFMLIDIDFWQHRLNTVMNNRPQSLQQVYSMFSAVAIYINKKFLISCLTAVTVLVICAIFKVQFGVMWAILTFAFNFIPNVGVFIVSAPMIAQAFMLNSLGAAIGFTSAIIVVHFLTGNIIEPRYMSKHLNLSNTVVWLSVLFWSIILGPIGMLLAIPLTTTIRILLSMSPHYAKLAMMMEGEVILSKADQQSQKKVDVHRLIREQSLAQKQSNKKKKVKNKKTQN
ncbi:AI-2E family transporter [Psittacicella gerlachiana]|uniref:AI-2E family transporter n=1 Tax=Psittacicella gerlachiana TaxID=2028574 RepID=A0A3A1YHS2_9GAMM|nr:AI-2E family transporter [Psittacicella gerlachiana]RIY35577.1 hypothetical protein CKF59_03460 [Psittacicella gerlachiana]